MSVSLKFLIAVFDTYPGVEDRLYQSANYW